MRPTTIAAFVAALTVLHDTQAFASPNGQLDLNIYADHEFHQLFPPFGGYARGYGDCYQVLIDLQPLYANFFNSDAGEAVSESLQSFNDDRDEFQRIDCTFHWDRQGDAFKEKCLGLKSSVEQAWSDFKASATWEDAKQTQTFKDAIAGYQNFCDCMARF